MGILVESSSANTTAPPAISSSSSTSLTSSASSLSDLNAKSPNSKKYYDFDSTMSANHYSPSSQTVNAPPALGPAPLPPHPAPPPPQGGPGSQCDPSPVGIVPHHQPPYDGVPPGGWSPHGPHGHPGGLPPPPPGPPPPQHPPLGTPELVEGGHNPPPLCQGCQLRIVDKFFLSAVNAKWHAACLKCSECGVELENQLSCFERDGHIYCKEDYLRIYNVSKCAKCHMEVQSSDLVMKARQYLFHVACFRCVTCDAALLKGDLFGMLDDLLYCKSHYEQQTGIVGGSFTPDHHSPVDVGPPPPSHPPPPPFHHGMPPPFPCGPFPPGAPDGAWFGGPPGSGGPPDFIPMGGPPPPGGPGGVGDFPYENNNEPMLKKRRGRKKRKVETFAAMNGFIEAGGYPPGLDGGPGGQGKTKRARTSFKHHQLRIMKHHFQMNQNPDSRELKVLSQKTQLDKKVLQVWFQNARAKWRRTRAQDAQGGAGGSGGNGGSNTPGGGGPSQLSGGPTQTMDEGDLALGSPSSDCSGPMNEPMIPCC